MTIRRRWESREPFTFAGGQVAPAIVTWERMFDERGRPLLGKVGEPVCIAARPDDDAPGAVTLMTPIGEPRMALLIALGARS